MKENSKSYSETCNTIRHYSNMSFTVRTLSVVQGLALTATWILNYQNSNYVILFILPIFGLLFTYLIYRFHKGYYDSTGFFIQEASEMEVLLFDEGHRPFQSFRKFHHEKYGKFWPTIFVLNAPFTLIAILFVFSFIGTLLKYNCII